MHPTEELFHLSQDRYEMTNLAGDPRYAGELANMRGLYEAELAAIAEKFAANHGYEPYGKLFDRSLAWDQKASLIESGPPAKSEKGQSEQRRKKRQNAAKSEEESP